MLVDASEPVDGITLPARSVTFFVAFVFVVEAGGGIEPLSEAGLAEDCRPTKGDGIEVLATKGVVIVGGEGCDWEVSLADRIGGAT